MADVDAQKALAAGYSQEEIDAENARRRGAAAPVTAAPIMEPTFGDRAADFAKHVVSTPFEMVSGVKRSLQSTGRGLRQVAAAVAPGLVDPEAARQAQVAAEAEEAAKPPSLTSDVWKTIGDVAPWMIGGAGMVPKVAAAFPKAAEAISMLPKTVRALGGGAAAGAAQAPTVPESDEYDLGSKLGIGAGFGAALAPVGWAAGKLYAPFRGKGSVKAQESAAVLNAEGLPHQIPATQTDSKYVRALTDALEQVPGFGSAVRKAREANAAWGTGKFTAPTGEAVSDITDEAWKRMQKEGNQALDVFKTGVNVPTSGIPAHMQTLVEQLIGTPTIASKTGTVKRIHNLERELTPTADISRKGEPGVYEAIESTAGTTPATGILQTIERAAGESGARGYPGVQATEPVTDLFSVRVPTQTGPRPGHFEQAPVTVENTTRTAKEMIDLRNEASKMASRKTGPYLEQKAARDLQDIVEQAIKDTHGDEGAAFDKALKQWGAMKDVGRAIGESGEHLVEGRIPVSRMVAASKGHSGMFPDRDRLVSAMASNMPDTPKGWNRALLTSLLLGAPLAGGGISKLAGGDFSTGAAVPVTLGASLAAGLSRKAPTQAQIDALRRALMGGAIGGQPEF